jgi:oligoribonuclease NrnB/cAMP/cGMP phosphodiesterase (DHH superfamily)
LESREKEVVTIMMSLFDEEQIRKTYIKDVTREITEKVREEITEKVTEEVTEKVTKETAEKTEIETAKRLIKKGKMTLDEIVDCVPTLTLDKLKEIEAEVMQMS